MSIDVKAFGGAKGDFVSDDTGAIQGTYNAADDGETVTWPAGGYVTSAPIVVRKPGIATLCEGALATNGGAGSGTGQFVPGVAGGVHGVDDFGAVIMPSASWAQGHAAAPAAFLVDASAGQMPMCAVERLWVDGSNAGTTLIHGIAAYGPANALGITGCGVKVLYGAGHGFHLIPSSRGDPAGPQAPQGAMIDRCLAQSIGGDGFRGSFGDGTLTRLHAQVVGGDGIRVLGGAPNGRVGQGGDTRISDCRADMSINGNGFNIDMPCGGFMGMINVSNCTTQRNGNNGFYIHSASGEAKPAPVYLANCTAEGDGINLLTNAAYRLSGPVAVSMLNCSSHVCTPDVAGGCPLYAVVTTAGGVSAPVMVDIRGGFYNSVTAFADKIAAPLASNVSAYAYTGGQWNKQAPTLLTAL